MALGVYSPIIKFQEGEADTSNNISLYEADFTEEAYKINNFISGGLVRNSIVMPAYNYSGNSMPSYKNVIYGRIYFFPSVVDVTGYVESAPISLDIWNANLTPVSINSITNVNLSGVSFLPATPYNMKYLEYLDANIYLASNYSSSATSNISFVFSNGYTFAVKIFGNKAYIFPFLHNWESPLVEKLSFLTNVIESHSGKEQRIKLRKTPRKELQSQTLIAYNSDFKEAARAKNLYRNLMFVAQDKSFLVPIDQDARIVPQDLPSGTNSVSINTEYHDYHVGGFVLLIKNPFYFEICQIDDISPNIINFSAGIVKNFSKGDTIVPLRQAIVNDDIISGSQIIDYNVEDYQQNWLVLVKDNLDTRPISYTPTLYKSIPLLLTYKHNWDSDSTVESYAPVTKIDYNVGQFFTDGKYRRNRERYSLDLLFKNREEYSQFLGFFNYLAGRLKAFWVPSYSHDLQMVSSQNSNATTFTAKYINYTSHIASDVLKKEIIFIKSDGTYLIRTINSSVDNGDGTETFTIDSNLGIATTPYSFEMICFLRYVRLDSDTIEVVYDGSSEIIRTKIVLTSLLNNPNTEN